MRFSFELIAPNTSMSVVRLLEDFKRTQNPLECWFFWTIARLAYLLEPFEFLTIKSIYLQIRGFSKHSCACRNQEIGTWYFRYLFRLAFILQNPAVISLPDNVMRSIGFIIISKIIKIFHYYSHIIIKQYCYSTPLILAHDHVSSSFMKTQCRSLCPYLYVFM